MNQWLEIPSLTWNRSTAARAGSCPAANVWPSGAGGAPAGPTTGRSPFRPRAATSFALFIPSHDSAEALDQRGRNHLELLAVQILRPHPACPEPLGSALRARGSAARRLWAPRGRRTRAALPAFAPSSLACAVTSAPHVLPLHPGGPGTVRFEGPQPVPKSIKVRNPRTGLFSPVSRV